MIDPRHALRVLFDLTRRLTEEAALEEALLVVTEAALELLPADHASVRLFDEARCELLAGARSGAGAHEQPLTFRRGEGIAGWVADQGKVAHVRDTESDPRFLVGTNQGFVVRSLLTVPLWAGGHVVGVLSVSAPQPHAFSGDDETMANLLANCAVPPVERARLQRLALTDPQTMAYNQRYLLPRLTDELNNARRISTPVSVLLADLDHFKRVNDEHGHAAGDEVLRGFVDRVRECVRRPDVLIRRGGEEFVLILPQAGPEQAYRAAERIRECLADSPVSGGEGITVKQTVSIGVATWDGTEDAAHLEHRADQAMYEAKRLGRNRVVSAS